MNRSLSFGLLLLAASATGVLAQDFNWRGRVARGGDIEIRGINGDITAVAASGSEVRVVAHKTAKRSDPDEVEIKVVEHDDGVTICAIYPSPRRSQPNTCEPGGGRSNTRDNDVQVEFEVQVPAGVRLLANTVNGAINASDLQGDIVANTVNGSIELSTTGLAKANTVNGSISASMGRANWTGDLEFTTVNGGITLEVGNDISADVKAETVNGDISTDFPLTVQGRFGPRRISGTIGRGGRTLHLTTVNGSIEIRQR
jgi:hypothetical protein